MYVSSAVHRQALPGDALSLALGAGHPLLCDLPQRLHTACLFEPRGGGTIAVLVTRAQPKRRRGVRYHAWWPQLAPSLSLLYAPREQIEGAEAFAHAYRAELDALPQRIWLDVLLELAAWLRKAPSVTLLSFERALNPSVEPQTLTQRGVLRDWLLGQLLLSRGERSR
jgi:uncharacterized protein YeaO (DUF488 family)